MLNEIHFHYCFSSFSVNNPFYRFYSSEPSLFALQRVCMIQKTVRELKRGNLINF